MPGLEFGAWDIQFSSLCKDIGPQGLGFAKTYATTVQTVDPRFGFLAWDGSIPAPIWDVGLWAFRVLGFFSVHQSGIQNTLACRSCVQS